jgi:hypothetical protein
VAGKYKMEPRGLPRDATNQLNKIFDAIEKDIGKGGKPALTVVPMRTPSPSGPVNLGGSVPGAIDNITEVNKGGGSPGPVGPPGPAGGAVVTDGVTIGGDGDGTPLFLEAPVTIANGGTGLFQSPTQQITTLGTLIAAGTAQAQPALSPLFGVTTGSAAMWSLPNAPDATWQTGIAVLVVCTLNTVTLYLVNPTAAPITPIAQLVNIKVIL